jgi:hypothetical protein
MDGISNLGTLEVFHQLGAPSNEIFSSTLSLLATCSTSAVKNERFVPKLLDWAMIRDEKRG